MLEKPGAEPLKLRDHAAHLQSECGQLDEEPDLRHVHAFVAHGAPASDVHKPLRDVRSADGAPPGRRVVLGDGVPAALAGKMPTASRVFALNWP